MFRVEFKHNLQHSPVISLSQHTMERLKILALPKVTNGPLVLMIVSKASSVFHFLCLFAVDLPPVDLNYYIIPWRMAENSPPLKQVLSSRFADYFKPIRAITLSLEMPFQDKLLASLLHTGNSIATYIPVAIIFI